MIHRHPICRNAIDQFFLERGKEALHPGIVVAMRHAAEALDKTVHSQRLPKSVAGVLAATVAVENSSADRKPARRGLDRVDAQFLPHIVLHAQGEDLAVEAVQDGRNVQLPVRALDLGNVRQQLLERRGGRKILFYEVFRLHRRRIGFRQPFRTPSPFVQPAMLPHEARQTPDTGTDSPLGQRQLHPLYPVVVVPFIIGIFDIDYQKIEVRVGYD